jgi:hypothetical protein
MRIDHTYITAHALVGAYKERGIHDSQMMVDADGCIDAPDILPAGAMRSLPYDDEIDLVEFSISVRENHHG